MTLRTWIEETGPKVIAQKLKVDPSTVSAWRNGQAFPRPKRLVQLHQLSKGKVTYEAMIQHFLKNN